MPKIEKAPAESPTSRAERHERHQLRMMLPKAVADAQNRWGKRRGGADLILDDDVKPENRCRVGIVELIPQGPGRRPWRTLKVRGVGPTFGQAFQDATRSDNDDARRAQERERARQERKAEKKA